MATLFVIEARLQQPITLKKVSIYVRHPVDSRCLEHIVCWNSHYGDVIMSVMAYQITSLDLFTQPFIQAQIEKSKLCVTGLFAGNSPVTGESPGQRASNAERFPFHVVIMRFPCACNLGAVWIKISLCCLLGHTQT